VFPADGSGRFQMNIVDAAADYDKELEKQREKQQEILAAVDRTTATRELDTKQLKAQSASLVPRCWLPSKTRSPRPGRMPIKPASRLTILH
jgi:hypothetical protein